MKQSRRRLWEGAAAAALCAALASSGHAVSCGTVKTVRLPSGGNYTSIQAAVNAVTNPIPSNWCINVDSSTYNETVTVQNFTFTYSTYTLTIQSDPNLVSTQTTVIGATEAPPSTGAAFNIANSSVNILGIKVLASNPASYGVYVSSDYVTISSVTVTTTAAVGYATAAVWFQGSNGAISYSTVNANNAGVNLAGSSITVSNSLTKTNTGSFSALILRRTGFRISNNTILQTFVDNQLGHSLTLSGADATTVSQSTITGAGSATGALFITGNSSNTTITQSFIYNSNDPGLYITISSSITITFSSITAAAPAGAVQVVTSVSTMTIKNSFINETGGGSGIRSNCLGSTPCVNITVDQSTITSAGATGILLTQTSSFTLTNSYADNYISVINSTGIVVNSNTLTQGIDFNASSSLSMSSNNITGSNGSKAAIHLTGFGGAVTLTNNTVTASTGIYVSTSGPGASLWITSNTIVPKLFANANSSGIMLDSLQSGATIESNGIYLRGATVGIGAAQSNFGIFAGNASGLLIDHNRISNPDNLSSGSATRLYLSGSQNVMVKFNDFYQYNTVGLNNVRQIELANSSTGAQIKDNIFYIHAALGAGTSTATLKVSANSESGFVSDYNAYYDDLSSTIFGWGGVDYAGVANWYSPGPGKDYHSATTAFPLWFDQNNEDFHPQSEGGRYNPATGTFVLDNITSPTIDAADPSEPLALETSPNGGVANQGSYGNTAQASRSANCGRVFNIGATGFDYTGIGNAFLDVYYYSFPGPECLVIRDTTTYNEQVTLYLYTPAVNNGYPLTIMADPSFVSSAPVVSPPGFSTAAFFVQLATVTINHIIVRPANAASYGVQGSSSYITLTNLAIQDDAGKIAVAGVSLSSYNTISASSVTVKSAPGLKILGSSNTVVNCLVSASTAVVVSGSTNTLVSSSALTGLTAGASALSMTGGAVNLTITTSTLTAGANGFGISLDPGGGGTITIATDTIRGGQYAISIATPAASAAVWITTNTILPALSATRNTFGVYLNGLSGGATIQTNGIYYRSSGGGAANTAYGLYAQSSSGLNINHNRISNPGIVTAGSYQGASFAGVTNSMFKFNDVNSTGTAFANGYLLMLTAGSTVQIMDNILFSSMVVTGSSATLSLSANSGLSSNYNDFFSSTSFNALIWGPSGYQFPWNASTGQDASSISNLPQWYDPGAGVEDFHPLSKKGRFYPVTQAWVIDGARSSTIDKADPAEPYSQEPAPNGGRANLGSYGNTNEASMTSGAVRVIVITGSPAFSAP